MNQTTDPSIIKWIVAALIVFVGFTLGVQGVCIVFNLTPPEGILREFTSASQVLTGMLGGLLMRTSSVPATTTQTTQTTIKTEPEKDSTKVKLALTLSAASLLLTSCVTIEAGLGGKTSQGQDWFVGVKTPPIPWPTKSTEPQLPSGNGGAKTPVLVSPQ